MQWRSPQLRVRGEGIVLVLVILAVLGGLAWYLYHARRNTEKEGWAYAREVAEHIILKKDTRYVDLNLSPQAQVDIPPSFRERIFAKLAEQGVPAPDIKLDGHITFSSHFFDARGFFRAQAAYPNGLVYLDMTVSPSHGPWQIEALNLTWNPERNF